MSGNSVRHWTADEVEAELEQIRGGTIGYGSSKDPMVSERNFLQAVLVNVMFERDTLAAKTDPSYRLPDWLGGHPVKIDRVGEMGQVRVWTPDHASTPIWLQRAELVQIPPPCTCPDHMRDHR